MVLNSLRACKEQTQKQNSNVDLGYLRLIWSQVEMGVQIIFMILLIKKTQEIKLNEKLYLLLIKWMVKLFSQDLISQ